MSKREYHWKYVGIDITYAEYERKLTEQDNKCAICGRDFSEFKVKPSVDHDHETGQVRSLLCVRCNSNVEVVESGKADVIREYLEYWEGVTNLTIRLL